MPLTPGEWETLSYEFKNKAFQHDPQFEEIYQKFSDNCGQDLQGFFAYGLPSWAVGSYEHKNLESEVLSSAWVAAENCHYKPIISNIKTYALGIARKVLRKWYRENEQRLIPYREPINRPDPHKELTQKELLDDLQDCLGKLAIENSDWYNNIFLTMLLDLPDAEAATVMDCAISTVSERRKRGLESLERCLKGKGWSEQDINGVLNIE